MEKVLEMGESRRSKYPSHFQVFIDNCVKSYAENFGPNDYLFAAVYFIILETGFSPVDLAEHPIAYDSVSFDIRKLRSITKYKDDQIKLSSSSEKEKCFVYKIPLQLGKHSSYICELQGVPSAEINTHLIINFHLKGTKNVKSLCLKTDSYVEKNEVPSDHKYLLKDLKILSLKVKNKVAIQMKDMILTDEEEGCSPNLLCLPEEIQKIIINYLSLHPSSVQSLSSTCTYFHNVITKDTKLWENMCFNEFSGWVLNKALQELCITGDANVFRTAFLFLKTQECAGQAVKVNNVVYLSGVIGLDTKTNQLVPGGVENETKQIFHNMEAVLKAAGSGFDKIVKASVFLNDINDFTKVNEIYKQFITKDHPARSAYQVGKLPVGAKVEIEAIALCGEVETKYITE